MADNLTLFERLRERVHDLLAATAPEVSPGPPPLPATCAIIQSISISPGAVVVGGVALPQNVIDQLNQLGLPLSWYSPSELEDAVDACAFDGCLIDEEEGIGFGEKLHFTAEKKEIHELRKIAAEIGEPVRVLTMQMCGLAHWHGTAAEHRSKMDAIRSFATGIPGMEPLPATAH